MSRIDHRIHMKIQHASLHERHMRFRLEIPDFITDIAIYHDLVGKRVHHIAKAVRPLIQRIQEFTKGLIDGRTSFSTDVQLLAACENRDQIMPLFIHYQVLKTDRQLLIDGETRAILQRFRLKQLLQKLLRSFDGDQALHTLLRSLAHGVEDRFRIGAVLPVIPVI